MLKARDNNLHMQNDFVQYQVQDMRRILAELKPLIGHYEWIWKIIRARTRQHNGRFPTRIYALLQRFFNPKKPYFIGRTVEGIRYLGDYRDDYSVIWATNPAFDQAATRLIRKHMKTVDGACLDVGANMGVFAAIMAAALDGREQVIAFEPVPETCNRAAATLALNSLQNVRLIQAAIGAEDAMLSLNTSPGYSAQASAHHLDKADPSTWTQIEVPVRTLDTLMQSDVIPRVSFIKVDVEGHELKAIIGSQELIRRDRPILIFEYNPHIAPITGWYPPDIASVVQQLAPYHFQVLHDSHELTPFPPSSESNEVVNIYGVVS